MPRNNSILHLAAALLLSLTAMSCASRSPAVITYPLTAETIRIGGGTLRAGVPRAWSASSVPPSGVAALLTSDDHSSQIALREIILDIIAGEKVRNSGLPLLARLSMSFRGDTTRSLARDPDLSEYRLADMDVCGYESTAGASWTSVIVLSIGGRYYECEATAPNMPREGTAQVAAAQKAFLSSVTTSSRE